MLASVPYRQCGAVILLLLPLSTGCTAWRSVPAYCYPSAIFYAPRSSQEPINFVHLRQDPPPVYLLGPRDVLGVYVEGVLGQSDEPPPVYFQEQANLPPAIGYPIPIREDGTLSLPLVPPIKVVGLSLAQAERLIRNAYTVDQKILQPGRDRIIVTLIKPRTYQVLVVREDATAPALRRGTSEGELILGSGKRGMTYAVELRAYENDVLHALSESGGLPGLDAKNEITILRGGYDAAEGPNAYLTALLQEPDGSPFTPEGLPFDPNLPGPSQNANTIKIPLRSSPDQPPPKITQDDIILNTGDVVFIESRDAEVFYTGGLLRGGQFPIPRDYDLDILGAIAMAGGSVASAAGGAAGQGSLGGGGRRGVGSIFPPTRAIVVRTVGGRQTSIRVDLKRALIDPQERILIEPNDFILLEYKPMELVLNIILNNVQLNYFLNNIE